MNTIRTRLPLILTGVLVIVLFLVPQGDLSIEQALLSRGFTLLFFLVIGGAFQTLAPIWSLIPSFFVIFFGFSLLKVVGLHVEPLVWMIVGGSLFFIWASTFMCYSERRVMTLSVEYASLKDLPLGRLIHFFVFSWAAAGALAFLYGVAVPFQYGVGIGDITIRAVGGCGVGALLAAISGKWKVYAVLFGIPALTVTMLSGINALTSIALGWLTGYIISCLLRDESTIYRPLSRMFRSPKSR